MYLFRRISPCLNFLKNLPEREYAPLQNCEKYHYIIAIELDK